MPWVDWDVPEDASYFTKCIGHDMYSWVTLSSLSDVLREFGYSVHVEQ